MTTMRVERFSLGRVIERTFAMTGRNFLPYYGLALLLTGLPALILRLLGIGRSMAATGFPMDWSRVVLMIANGLISLIAAFVLQAALVHATVNDLSGRRGSMSDSLRRALLVFLPMLGIAIVLGASVVLGFALLFVPGLIVLTIWSVAVPVEAIERAGVFGSLGRSASLTRGVRWQVFGLLVLAWVAALIVQGLASVVIGAVFFGGVGAMMRPIDWAPLSLVGLVLSVVLGALVQMVQAVGAAALYYELRASKEGIGPETLASIFD